MLIHWTNGDINFYKFKAKDIDLLLPALYDQKFNEIVDQDLKISEISD